MNRLSASDPHSPVGAWVAYVAALWASVFAIFHIIWAAGWYPLLHAEQARVAFATPWKWAFDVVVAAMCVIAVSVTLEPWFYLGAILFSLSTWRSHCLRSVGRSR